MRRGRRWRRVAVAGAFALALPAGADAAVPANTTAPGLSDATPTAGQVLTPFNGVWTGTPSAYAYRWQICTTSSSADSCADGPDGTDDAFVLGPGATGKWVRVVVTASNADGAGAPAASLVSAAVNTAPGAPAGGVPALTPLDARAVGATYTVDPGSWTPGTPSFSYRWLRCDAAGEGCRTLAGPGLANTYVSVDGDAGHALKAIVVAAGGGGSTARVAGHAAAVLAPPPPVVPVVPGGETPGGGAPPPPAAAVVVPPAVTPLSPVLPRPAKPAIRTPARVVGRARAGRTLTVSTGRWSGAPSFRFQWLRGGKAIKGATASSYHVRRADRRRRIACRLTAGNAGGRATFTTASVRVAAR
jgi:hypothetical protein